MIPIANFSPLWLTQDRDTRLHIDPLSGVNAYGVAAMPDSEVLEWGSATASAISLDGLKAAEQWWQVQPQRDEEKRDLSALRESLLRECELDREDLWCGLYPSGTEGLRAAALVCRGEGGDKRLFFCQEEETGRRVPAALQQALGISEADMSPICLRAPSGTIRSLGAVDEQLRVGVMHALGQGQRVVLVLTEGTKTGRIVPGVGCVRELSQAYPERIKVIVDACQFRLSNTRLQRYVRWGWLVVVTGSKFLGGPPFSGALLMMRQGLGERMRQRLRALEAELMDRAAQLRWVAALAELSQWRAVPKAALVPLLERLVPRINRALAEHPEFIVEPCSLLQRDDEDDGMWDSYPTLFPFEVRRSQGGTRLSLEALQAVFLQLPRSGEGVRGRLGQPVMLGHDHGEPRWALRLCLGARLLVPILRHEQSALAETGCLDQCRSLLERTADLVRKL